MALVGIEGPLDTHQSLAPGPCELKPDISAKATGIVTDNDGRIWMIGFRDASMPTVRQIGTVPLPAPSADEMKTIPKDEIITGRQQFTCKKMDWRILAVSTVRGIQANSRLSYEHILRVILIHGSEDKTMLKKTYSRINRMALDDVNGDGIPEVAVQWSDGSLISPANMVDMWRIDGNGQLMPIDLGNVYKEMDAPFASHGDTVDWGFPQGQNFSLVSEQRIVEAEHHTQIIRKYYKWNSTRGRYELSSKIVAQEQVIQK
jgi:hypothetical protein